MMLAVRRAAKGMTGSTRSESLAADAHESNLQSRHHGNSIWMISDAERRDA